MVAAQTQTRKPADDDVIRVTSNLVSVPVSVKDRRGAYLTDLRRQDFHIFEDGVEQEISSFETTAQPFTVILMMDLSDSTRIDLKDIKRAAIAFLNQLQGQDKAVVIGFDASVTALTGATGDRAVLSTAINSVKSGGGTSLYDAVHVAMANHRRTGGRQAMVLLTDGIDTSSSTASFDSTVRQAAEQYSLIYPIQYKGPDETTPAIFGATMQTMPNGESIHKAYERGTRYLNLLATNSGGRFQFVSNLKTLEASFAHIAEELREQYSLGYYPKNKTATKNGKRKIKVVVDNAGAVVRARESYSYHPDQP